MNRLEGHDLFDKSIWIVLQYQYIIIDIGKVVTLIKFNKKIWYVQVSLIISDYQDVSCLGCLKVGIAQPTHNHILKGQWTYLSPALDITISYISVPASFKSIENLNLFIYHFMAHCKLLFLRTIIIYITKRTICNQSSKENCNPSDCLKQRRGEFIQREFIKKSPTLKPNSSFHSCFVANQIDNICRNGI